MRPAIHALNAGYNESLNVGKAHGSKMRRGVPLLKQTKVIRVRSALRTTLARTHTKCNSTQQFRRNDHYIANL